MFVMVNTEECNSSFIFIHFRRVEPPGAGDFFTILVSVESSQLFEEVLWSIHIS